PPEYHAPPGRPRQPATASCRTPKPENRKPNTENPRAERAEEMARLILGVTGSVAAIKTPALVGALRAARHDVRVVATRPALYFFDPAEREQGDSGPPEGSADRWVFRDEAEWHG